MQERATTDCSSEWRSCARAPGTAPDSAIGEETRSRLCDPSPDFQGNDLMATRKLLVTRPFTSIKVLGKFWKIAERWIWSRSGRLSISRQRDAIAKSDFRRRFTYRLCKGGGISEIFHPSVWLKSRYESRTIHIRKKQIVFVRKTKIAEWESYKYCCKRLFFFYEIKIK